MIRRCDSEILIYSLPPFPFLFFLLDFFIFDSRKERRGEGVRGVE